ncbi:MAG TPA: HEAT repeat domain-containing protein [Candidatus Angelobacter sp.]|nr:HEAT repeat domain-containing protein [Candidatus Angelobacter sp.]
MNCDWTKENIVFYVYEELADDARFEVERHVQHCVPCKHELESALALKKSMSLFPVQEISPSFLTASRMKLQEALEHAEQSRGLRHFIFDLAGWMQQIKLAPAMTVALLMLGFAGGALTTYKLRSGPAPIVEPANVEASFAGVESIASNPNSGLVSIKYDTLHPQLLEGSATDPKIQQLLVLGTQDSRNPGVQHDAFDLLAKLDKKQENDDVREAFIYAVRYDKNPGVRLQALEGLRSYVKDDVHVRDAVLEALMHDTNAGVRQEAISLLDPVKADMSVREALRVLADHDQNKFIKAESRRVLASTPTLE